MNRRSPIPGFCIEIRNRVHQVHLAQRSEQLNGVLKEKPGAWPGLSVQAVVRLSSDALPLATTQYQEATDEQRQPTSS
jgi:hypothetical protein